MRLRRARVQNYRSIKDSGWFEIDDAKTILVGPNEGGKTAVLRALEQLNPGHLVRPLDPLRDFPRSEYHRIQTGAVRPDEVVVAEAEYELDEDERAMVAAVSPLFSESRYYRAVHLDNSITEQILHAPTPPTVGALKDSLRRMAVHADPRFPPQPGTGGLEGPAMGPSDQLDRLLDSLPDAHELTDYDAQRLGNWLDVVVAPYVAVDNETEMSRLAALREAIGSVQAHARVLDEFHRRIPVMVYVSTYPSVTPMLHLGHLADAVDAGAIDEADDYNFGNFCLLSLLRFSARQLSDLGKAQEPAFGDTEGFERYRAQLDERDAALAAASLYLTNHIRAVWQPSDEAAEVGRRSKRTDYAIRITADQQYLKVVVEDSLGVQIELDQRSQGFKWLVSFFVVFFAQASDRTRQAVLLLDEPGLSLHGLKQREFRHTLSALGASNQLLFTTHSPFLIGTDELALVRVVELADRAVGTKIRSDLAAEDPSSVLPLREALAYDLTSSLFSAAKTLILEDLTDYWYLSATAAMLEDAGMATLDKDIELIPVSSVAKIVYFSTFLEADDLKVAALLDSDAAGEHAELQQRLVESLGSRRVLRTKDSYEGPVSGPRIEELLRETLVSIGQQLGWEVGEESARDWGARPISEVFAKVAGVEYTPYRLAKEYVRWSRDHRAADLTATERIQWMGFIERINQAFA
ncbi:MAG TPA: AAA family ATPase [Acidimicrobiales bacterium]|nr:AAA family ATPase [Acidimicrobiales bacterium]